MITRIRVFLLILGLFQSCGRVDIRTSQSEAGADSSIEHCNPQLPQVGGGDGSPSSPWLLCHSNHLNHIDLRPNDHFAMETDIDATPTPRIPLANTETGFNGVFNGKGNVLKVRVVAPNRDHVGFFTRLSARSMVMDLRLEVDIEGRSRVAGLAGMNFGIVRNVQVTGIIKSVGSASGFVSRNEGSIFDSRVHDTDIRAVEVGGGRTVWMAGMVSHQAGPQAQIVRSHVSNTRISSTSLVVYTGGLISEMKDGVILESTARRIVLGRGKTSAGFVAHHFGGQILRSEAREMGIEPGSSIMGGFVGFLGPNLGDTDTYPPARIENSLIADSEFPGLAGGSFIGVLGVNNPVVLASLSTGTWLNPSSEKFIGGVQMLSSCIGLIGNAYLSTLGGLDPHCSDSNQVIGHPSENLFSLGAQEGPSSVFILPFHFWDRNIWRFEDGHYPKLKLP